MKRLRSGLVITAYNRLPWPVAKRLVRVVEFSDDTYALGWRWSKTFWQAGRVPF